MSKLCLQRKIEKHYICEIITFNLFCSNSTKCYLRISEQIINLVYNDMKNLTYIFVGSNRVHSVFDTRSKSFYLCEIIAFNKLCAIPHKCRMRRNKQLIKLVYNNMKNFTYILISCNCVQIVSSKKALSMRITFNMLCCNSTKMLHADEQGTY